MTINVLFTFCQAELIAYLMCYQKCQSLVYINENVSLNQKTDSNQQINQLYSKL